MSHYQSLGGRGGNAYPPYGGQNNPYASSQANFQSTDSFSTDPFKDPYAHSAAPSPQYQYGKGSAFEGGAGKTGNSGGGWKRWALIGGIVVVVIGAVAGGIAAWKSMSGGSSSSGSSSASDTSGPSNPENNSDLGDDPSVFEKDSRLKQSFWGIAYTPKDVQLPWCTATQKNVTKEIQIISQVTTRIRTYGSDCNQSAMIMQAIQDTKVDLGVWLGVYVDDNATTWERQKSDTLNVLQTYGLDNVRGVTVGNEYILLQDESAASYQFIIDKVAEFKKELDALNLGKAIPVGTADAGSAITANLAQNVDFVMANVHPWFGGLPIDEAAGWTWEFFEDNDVAVAGNTPAYIAETGWPTQSMTPENATLKAAVAGVPELQTFLDTYVCAANKNESKYFFFEVFDEPWKEMYGGVEPYWGLFDSNRIMKDITIPDCAPTAGDT